MPIKISPAQSPALLRGSSDESIKVRLFPADFGLFRSTGPAGLVSFLKTSVFKAYLRKSAAELGNNYSENLFFANSFMYVNKCENTRDYENVSTVITGWCDF